MTDDKELEQRVAWLEQAAVTAIKFMAMTMGSIWGFGVYYLADSMLAAIIVGLVLFFVLDRYLRRGAPEHVRTSTSTLD
jgi:uncharacterized membrane protein YhfC